MPKLIFLGTASAVPDTNHENTHLAIATPERLIVIDSPGSPIVRLETAHLLGLKLTDLILTHCHPDHVSGVPSLLMSLWLLGRKEPLQIHGLAYTLNRVRDMMDAYQWETWPGFYPVLFHNLPEEEKTPVLEDDDFRITASPGRHLVPTLGFRIESAHTSQSVVYSADTEPCEEILRLASGANILIHEASGATIGHTSAAQAGALARQAGVDHLYLVHYPNRSYEPENLAKEAQETFGGPVIVAQDFMEVDF